MSTFRCCRCEQVLPLSQFYIRRGRASNRPMSICKDCRRHLNKNHPSKDINRDIMRKAKDVPCADCGERYPHYVMDFDHRDPSEKSFPIGGTQSRATQSVIDEIAKCDVVCANCHRERTHGQRGGDASPVVAVAEG